VRPIVVVGSQPLVRDRLDLGQGREDVGVEHLLAVRAVEAFDEGVLIGLAGLDVAELDRVLLTPVREDLRGELGTVVEPQRGWSG
jgi:hypothetical protein